jgi:hypothetical protein
MLTNITNTIIAITADSENGHEDAGRGELCVESRKKKVHIKYSRGEWESRGRTHRSFVVFFLTFAMCCVAPFTVSKSKSSHEDAGQDQGEFVSGRFRGGDP